MRRLPWFVVFVLVAGCGTPPAAPTAKSSLQTVEGETLTFRPYVPPEVPKARPIDAVPLAADSSPTLEEIGTKPKDAVATPDLVYTIEVFELLLPRATVSRNTELWKRIDENSVDVATYDVLYKNGVRVGVAPMAELDPIKQLTETRKIKSYTLSGAQGSQIELEMNLNVEQQTLFCFDLRNELRGRYYDKSDNLLMMSFESTPRKPGWIRLAMMPTIKSTQKKLIYSVLAGRADKEFSFQVLETPLDMNLRVDMPVSQFLIIAPSPEATWGSSLGNAFLSKDTGTEKLERVLVVVPHAFERKGASE